MGAPVLQRDLRYFQKQWPHCLRVEWQEQGDGDVAVTVVLDVAQAVEVAGRANLVDLTVLTRPAAQSHC